IDDSAYVRKVVKQMLSRSPFIEVVGAARDGNEGLELAAQLDPDVVTCDLIMPGMDGVAFVREQMARKPRPIVIVSIANDSGEMALAALDAGAIDFVQKPTALATEKIFDVGDELVEKVKAAAAVSVKELNRAPKNDAEPGQIGFTQGTRLVDIIVVGVSTGGPQALKQFIPQLPSDFRVPVAIVLHMPLGYTGMYARKLDQMSPLRVIEAQDGDPVAPGTVLIAPAGRHLSFTRTSDGGVMASLTSRPFDTPHRPSVDVL